MPEQESKYSDEIAALREELAKSHDELLRVRARESRLKSEHGKFLESSSNENHELRGEIVEFKEREKNLLAEKAALKKQCAALERENKRLKSGCPLDGKSPDVCQSLKNAREFLAALPGNLKQLLLAADFAPDDLAAFLGRCGSAAGMAEIWQRARERVLQEPGSAKETLSFLATLLHFHALGNGPASAAVYEPDLAAVDCLEASGFWVIPFRENWWEEPACVRETLLPGLAGADGALLVEPLLALKNDG